MSTERDLEDVAAQSPLAMRELAELRDRLLLSQRIAQRIMDTFEPPASTDDLRSRKSWDALRRIANSTGSESVERGVADAAAKITASQKPLDPDAARVLYDNIDDLYVGTGSEPEEDECSECCGTGEVLDHFGIISCSKCGGSGVSEAPDLTPPDREAECGTSVTDECPRCGAEPWEPCDDTSAAEDRVRREQAPWWAAMGEWILGGPWPEEE